MKVQKLSKDQTQKIILSTLGFIGLIYCYFTFFLGPLNRNREAMIHKMADVEKKIASSKTELKKTASLELQAKEATGRYEALKRTTLDGAPIAWFPPKVRAFFARYDIDKATARLASSGDFKQPQMSDWINDSWDVDLPESDFDSLGRSISDLENSEPLLTVQRITIHAVPDQPQYQQVSLHAQTALFKK